MNKWINVSFYIQVYITKKIITTKIRNKITIVQICPMSFVFSNFPNLSCTKFSFCVVLSISPSRSIINPPCLSISLLIYLPCSFSRPAISFISSKCWSCSSTNSTFILFIRPFWIEFYYRPKFFNYNYDMRNLFLLFQSKFITLITRIVIFVTEVFDSLL